MPELMKNSDKVKILQLKKSYNFELLKYLCLSNLLISKFGKITFILLSKLQEMRKLIFFALLLMLPINYCYPQSGWYSTFFNNTATFTNIIARDSSNLFATCNYGKPYYKSTDGGNNWECLPEYSFDSAYSIFDGCFVNSQTGWLVGSGSQFNNGIILKTTNGGINWFKQETGFGYYTCYCINFINENTGWIGSSGGTVGYLLKTTNGGLNWTKKEFPGAYQIRSVKFFDGNSGWISGLYNLVGRTTDGGETWINKQSNISCTNFRSLSPVSMNECWALSVCLSQGMSFSLLYKTTNAGDNWDQMYSHTDSLTTDAHTFSKIKFINSETGFVNGSFNFILRTTNSGLNWSKQTVVSGIGGNPIISALLSSGNSILACGGYSGAGFYKPFNYILKSSNSGVNWDLKSYNYEHSFSKIFFIDQFTGFVFADSGKVFRTTNSGNNWNLLNQGNNYWFYDISFNNFPSGFATERFNRILKTTNGGENWSSIYNYSTRLNNIKFFNENTGLVGTYGNKMLKTTDAGVNWDTINLMHPSTPYTITDFSFINDSTGWASGHYRIGFPFSYEKNAFWKTTNRGENWNLVFDSLGSGQNFHVQFLDQNTGHKVSNNRVQKTTNGGSNWFSIDLPGGFNVNDLKFINLNTGWLVGSKKVFKTTNGGQNWLLQFEDNNKNNYSVDAIDLNNAWFCTDKSEIYKTINGGGVIGISTISSTIPDNISLSQNYPNPFNPSTKIKFEVSKKALTSLIVYDLLGREITTLVNEVVSPGTYQVDLDASNFPSGVYFYRIISGDFIETKKMVLIK